jgi:hypothetical protein
MAKLMGKLMRHTTGKTLAAWVVLVGAAGLVGGCSSSGSGNGGSGGSGSGTGGGMSAGGGGSGSGTGGTTSGSGGGSGGGNSNCVIPTTWTENLMDISSQCLPCAQMYCCDKIVTCAGNTACLDIYKCEQNCYNGIGPDGGVVADDDAGTDDAGATAMDRCVEQCKATGSAAGKPAYDDQDSCINGLLPTNCGKMEVCY